MKEITAIITDPLTIPMAISHFCDDHGKVYQSQEILNKKIVGFKIQAKVHGTTESSRFGHRTDLNTYEIEDLYHSGENVGIYAENNIIKKDLWIRMILEIPENKKMIEKALAEELEDTNLREGQIQFEYYPYRESRCSDSLN